MDRSILVRWVGFPGTLVHGDPLVLDRWFWLCRHLPVTCTVSDCLTWVAALVRLRWVLRDAGIKRPDSAGIEKSDRGPGTS